MWAQPEIAGTTAAAAADDPTAVSAWREARAASDIQFAPVLHPTAPAAKPPGWLEWLLSTLQRLLEPIGRALGVSWPVIEKVLIGAAAALVLFLAWRLLAPWFAALRARMAEPAAEWAPDRGAALALLEDADRLAAQGQYGEAAHLLLQRSVAHIAATRPEWLQPASTAREIAALPALPDRARAAFAAITAKVERSLFALRALEVADWQAARAAYADFALADLRA